jgi:hypothetical protein
MAGIAYYTIAGKQVGGHYVRTPAIASAAALQLGLKLT